MAAHAGGLKPPLLGDRYVVRRRIGRGGTASVYVVYDLRLRVWRAAKVMHATTAENLDLRERFVLEAAAMANLEHPNVARVTDVVGAAAIPYIVLELLEGGSVATWVQTNGPMPVDLAVDVMLDVSAALAFVHARSVVHRDVNPRNLMIDRDGGIKLTDFGVARIDVGAVVGTSSPDDHGSVMGTQAYMAPEQRRPGTVDARADIYAAGATLYALLTGRLPPDLSGLGPRDKRIREMPPLLAPVVMKACALAPKDRHANATALRDALVALRKRMPSSQTRSLLIPTTARISGGPPARLDPAEATTVAELVASGATDRTFDRTESSSQPPRQVAVKEGFPWGRFAAGGAVGLLALLFLVFLGAVQGARSIDQARASSEGAHLRYLGMVSLHRTAVDRVPDPVEAKAIEDAYRRFETLPDPAAIEGVHQAWSRAAGRMPGTEAAGDLDRARAESLAAKRRLGQAARSLPARVAVFLGFRSADKPQR